MKAQYYLLAFLLVLTSCPARTYGQEPIAISLSGGLADVASRSGVFLDETSLLTAQDIASGKHNGKFTYGHTAVVNYGITHGTSWCTFRIAGTGKERVFLSVLNPIVDSVRLYKVTNGHAVQTGGGGLYLPVSSRQIVTENNMFELDAEADTATYLLSLKSSRVHVYALRAGHLPDHMKAINLSSLWNAIFIGFVLMMVLYHLFLFFSIRSIPYLYYIGYVLSFGLFNAFLNGSAFVYLWPSHPALNHYDNLLSCSAGVFSALFTITSLDLRKYAPRLRIAAYVVAALYAANIAVVLLGYSFAAFLLLRNIVLVAAVVTIASGITALRKGFKPARYFLIAYTFSVTGVMVFLIINLNYLRYGFLATHAMQIAAMMEALALSFTLADRFNRYKKEKEQLMRTQNELLEQKVAERTEQLKKQQQETEQLLLNILPEEVAAELKENGVARSRNYEAVTVLFTDFKDFTRIVETISPEDLIADLNHCFSAFDKIVGRYGIEKIKTIGDSYMCAGGFGVADPDSALNVVKAGIEIRDFIRERNKQVAGMGGNVLEVRIGIHTGPVIAGIIGIKKFAYDIWGDTVNIASRMETASDTGKVNISGATYELVKDSFVCTYRGKMPAKNKGEVDMYFADWK